MREILPLAAVDWAAMIGLMVNIPEGPASVGITTPEPKNTEPKKTIIGAAWTIAPERQLLCLAGSLVEIGGEHPQCARPATLPQASPRRARSCDRTAGVGAGATLGQRATARLMGKSLRGGDDQG
jgi:hypothetical protein